MKEPCETHRELYGLLQMVIDVYRLFIDSYKVLGIVIDFYRYLKISYSTFTTLLSLISSGNINLYDIL